MIHSLPQFLRLFILAISISSISSSGQAATRVIISAEASVEYGRQHGTASNDQKTSYHFVEGKKNKGYANDKSLQKVSFFDIAENLAQHLTKQNYYPSSNMKENDVMLLVNWGVTAVEESFEDIYGITSDEEYDQLFGSPIVSEGSEGETVVSYEPRAAPNWGAIGKRANSRMLGFWDTLHDGSLMPSEHHEFQSLLNEERYFIVVIAFDNKKYNKKENEILWVTRFSMRAAGISFTQAFPELTATASDYFGENIAGLTRKRTDDKSHVEVGDIEVLNTVDSDENE